MEFTIVRNSTAVDSVLQTNTSTKQIGFYKLPLLIILQQIAYVTA